MNLIQHPELLDKLAASYALGTLRGGARRRFETLAREQAPVRAAALIWQARIGSVAELQTPAQPTPAVWTRIDNLVQADVQRQAMRDAHAALPATGGGWLRNLFLWRGAAAAGVAAAIVAMVVGLDQRAQLGTQIASLQTQLLATPQIKYVAVLADGKADPSMLVTFDARTNKLLLQRVGGYQEASDKSLQLWALPPSGGPRSLGVLGTDKLLRLAAGEADVQQVPTLAVTLEPKGGVPVGSGPTGPVLFKGALIQKML
nr:anti-sigma factor [uncultured Albidiferax sp.]